MSPLAGARRVDRLVAIAISANAVLAAAVGIGTGYSAAVLLPVLAAATALAWVLAQRFGGTTLSAYGLVSLLAVLALATARLQPAWPELYVNLLLVMSLLPGYRRWPLVALFGTLFVAAPFAGGPEMREGGRLVYALFVAAQTGLLAYIAWRNEVQSRELFDIDFLIRAMGRQGAIRLDLGVLRAETPLGQRLKDVQERVAATLQQVQQSALEANAAAASLQASGQELSVRTEAAGNELNASAMTLTQIAVIVKESANAAMAARQTAQDASAMAADGGRTVGQMVDQMQAIDAASRRITDIIGVIESIAFQTNMLALNAAVEAARAGEQGRGFAVVASEVRTLAQRASKAAAEVKTLVDDTVQAVGRGNLLAGQARETIDKLTGTVSRVDEVFHSLSADTNEHAAGIEAIRDTMNELNEQTQRNLAVAAQAERIAGELAARAAGLTEVMSGFRLGPAGAAPAVPTVTTAAKAAQAAISAAPAAKPKPKQQETVEFF